ncbi:MAG: GNAT family N-acetyltransferase, partial [Mailhella sp.]|nr:GNAT family N-acetyltransferase [Mailhella sp.]
MDQPRSAVPEHSPSLMEALSGGRAFTEGQFLFTAAEDWLMCVGYPLEGTFSLDAFEKALRAAVKRAKPGSCFAIAPAFPPRLQKHVVESDVYYDLPASAPVPPKLRGPVRRAGLVLRVEECGSFT